MHTASSSSSPTCNASRLLNLGQIHGFHSCAVTEAGGGLCAAAAAAAEPRAARGGRVRGHPEAVARLDLLGGVQGSGDHATARESFFWPPVCCAVLCYASSEWSPLTNFDRSIDWFLIRPGLIDSVEAHPREEGVHRHAAGDGPGLLCTRGRHRAARAVASALP